MVDVGQFLVRLSSVACLEAFSGLARLVAKRLVSLINYSCTFFGIFLGTFARRHRPTGSVFCGWLPAFGECVRGGQFRLFVPSI